MCSERNCCLKKSGAHWIMNANNDGTGGSDWFHTPGDGSAAGDTAILNFGTIAQPQMRGDGFDRHHAPDVADRTDDDRDIEHGEFSGSGAKSSAAAEDGVMEFILLLLQYDLGKPSSQHLNH